MVANQWNDYLAGTDEYNVEEIMFRLQELYRLINGSPGWGRVGNFNQYDGGSFAMDIQSLEDTTSPTLFSRVFDDSVTYTQDINGNQWEGPWTFTGNGEITGNVLLTGTFHVTGAVDFDSTLNVDGAVTLQSTLHGIGAVDFDSTLNVDGNATFNANVTLGNAAGDVITGTGTATFAEDFTLSKRLIVAGNIVNDTTTFVTDATNNKVGIGAVPVSTDPMFQVAGNIRATAQANPTTGSGVELAYITGGTPKGVLIPIDRATAAIKEMDIYGAPIVFLGNGAEKMKIDNGGIGFFAHAVAGQQTIDAAVTGTADGTYSGTEQNMLNDLKSAVNSIRSALLATGYAV